MIGIYILVFLAVFIIVYQISVIKRLQKDIDDIQFRLAEQNEKNYILYMKLKNLIEDK